MWLIWTDDEAFSNFEYQNIEKNEKRMPISAVPYCSTSYKQSFWCSLLSSGFNVSIWAAI